jgi:prepilin-type N-terminal cleavage/methylation domain-containing protein
VKKRGFTLIEILVVLSIIIILMALIIPAILAVKRQATATYLSVEEPTSNFTYKVIEGINIDRPKTLYEIEFCGCEYIILDSYRNIAMVHKHNCKYCSKNLKLEKDK